MEVSSGHWTQGLCLELSSNWGRAWRCWSSLDQRRRPIIGGITGLHSPWRLNHKGQVLAQLESPSVSSLIQGPVRPAIGYQNLRSSTKKASLRCWLLFRKSRQTKNWLTGLGPHLVFFPSLLREESCVKAQRIALASSVWASSSQCTLIGAF